MVFNKQSIILGAGITGLSAGMKTGYPIYESSDYPGGICTSYYRANGHKKNSNENDEAYHFETGGGHWIFGADNRVLKLINNLSPLKSYSRKSAVYFPDLRVYVPYPLQKNLSYLPKDIVEKVIDEMMHTDGKNVATLADWLLSSFGPTLCELFFFPFHELYTTGLYTKTAPQDDYKTPSYKEDLPKDQDKRKHAGYNASFVYPTEGLDELTKRISEKCIINHQKTAVKIDMRKQEVSFKDGSSVFYDHIISTLPLNKMTEICGLEPDEMAPPYVSVMVINIGAIKGKNCPDYHWVYIPKSKSGFYRVGFYSNVDNSFLPLNKRKTNDRVNIYVEKAYPGGSTIDNKAVKILCDSVVKELQEWQWIKETEVIDPTWINVAYTYEYPGSQWKEKALGMLKKSNIHQIGRYGTWHFQGIAESIKDGLSFSL